MKPKLIISDWFLNKEIFFFWFKLNYFYKTNNLRVFSRFSCVMQDLYHQVQPIVVYLMWIVLVRAVNHAVRNWKQDWVCNHTLHHKQFLDHSSIPTIITIQRNSEIFGTIAMFNVSTRFYFYIYFSFRNYKREKYLKIWFKYIFEVCFSVFRFWTKIFLFVLKCIQ